ncbi:NfeD family protein [Roseovarius aquimarinus]|uniref:NfeD family protein n=1 Tax=Roseovarius aquimarinus TaxID=1229156 RepID=A0ABW7I438_9RHOB
MIELAETLPLWQLWWVWLAGAMLLAMLELALPGFMALGFAIGAALVGILLALAPPALGLSALVALWAVLSLIAWAVLRRVFRFRTGQVRRVRDDINRH